MKALLVLVLAVLLAGALAACGHEEEHEVREGEPLEVEELDYFVKLTRFLNPNDTEDMAYLEGAPELEPGHQYLGVFMTVENTSDDPRAPSREMYVTDTRANRFDPLRLDNLFALTNDPIPGDEIVPLEGSPAEAGPIKGSLVLFSVPEETTENRPLELVIPDPGEQEPGRVELDI